MRKIKGFRINNTFLRAVEDFWLEEGINYVPSFVLGQIPFQDARLRSRQLNSQVALSLLRNDDCPVPVREAIYNHIRELYFDDYRNKRPLDE